MKDVKISIDCEHINLSVYDPPKKTEAKNFPAVIIVPGGKGRHFVVDPNIGDIFTGYDDLASELSKCGFYAITFDSRGQGQSEGLRSHENGCVDLQKVLDFVCEIPEVDTKRIGIFGKCGGGAIGLHLTLKDDRIKSIMTWGMPPRFDELNTKEIEERLLRAGVRVQKGSALLNGEDAAMNIRQPLIVAGGTEDTKWFFINGSAKRQLDMIEAITERGSSSKVRFEILRGAPHAIDSKHKCFKQFTDLVVEWFQETLN